MIKLPWISLFLLISFSLLAQDPFYIRYDAENGLPSSQVYDLQFDKNGILWIATDRGVCTYDGYDFKTFTTSEGLSHNTNFIISQDNNDDLWFAAIDGSLSKYSDKGFQQPLVNEALRSLSPGNWIGQILFDEANNLCFALNEKSNSKKQVNKEYLFYQIPPTADTLLEISILPEKRKEKKRWYTKSFGNEKLIFDTKYEDFIATLHLEETGEDIILSVNPLKNRAFYKYRILKRKGEAIEILYETLDVIDDIYLDHEGNIMVCTEKGVLVLDSKNPRDKPNKFFSQFFITSVAQDANCHFWFSTLNNGILFVPTLDFQGLFGNDFPENFGDIESVEVFNNFLLLGSSTGGILQVDTALAYKYLLENDNSRAITNINSKANVAYTSYSFKIQQDKNGLNATQQHWIWTPSRIVKELNNGILFAGRSSFLIFDKNREVIFNSGKVEKPFRKRINCVEHDSLGNIFIGTSVGLYRIREDQYQPYDDLTLKNPILKTAISEVKNVTGETQWICTIGNGLLFQTPDTIFQVSTVDGLASNLVNSILVFNDTTAWVGTNRGLSKLIYKYDNNNFEIVSVTTLNATIGLPSNNILDIARWNNQLWINTGKGLYFFDPKTIQPCLSQTPISMTNVLVNNETVKPIPKLVLDHTQNNISFEFKGISYSKPSNQKFYRYRFYRKGSHSDWKYSNERRLLLPNLVPGDYIFQAGAINVDGSWSENSLEQKIKIRPPITQRIWFRIFSFLALIFILGFWFYRWNKRRKQHENQERLVREAEMRIKNAELGMLRKQMNPHFIFNALNSIQNYIFDNNISKANYYLSSFSKLMRSSIQMSKLGNITLKEEISFLKTYLELEQLRFPDLFDYEIDVVQEISIYHYQIPPLLIQPLLENAIKHGFNGIKYKGKLSLNIYLPEKEIPVYHIVIQDNGIGLSGNQHGKMKTSDHQSVSLDIMKERINILNHQFGKPIASFKIEEIPPQKGTKVTLIIPVNMISL